MSLLEDNAVLERMLDIGTPGPLDTGNGSEWKEAPDADEVNRARRVFGVLYERDAASLIQDAQYDRIGKWCKDAAATAMDWRDYPAEDIAMADACLRAWQHRLGIGNQDCPECGAETWGFECLHEETREVNEPTGVDARLPVNAVR